MLKQHYGDFYGLTDESPVGDLSFRQMGLEYKPKTFLFRDTKEAKTARERGEFRRFDEWQVQKNADMDAYELQQELENRIGFSLVSEEEVEGYKVIEATEYDLTLIHKKTRNKMIIDTFQRQN